MTRKKAIEAAAQQAIGDHKLPAPEVLRVWIAEGRAEDQIDPDARWPERTRQLREALDEIELLKGAMAADDERLRTHGMRVGIWFGCDTAEHMADEIERLKAAGKVLAESLRTNWGGEISRKEDEACKVFEEGECSNRT